MLVLPAGRFYIRYVDVTGIELLFSAGATLFYLKKPI